MSDPMDTQTTNRGPFAGKPKLSLMVQETNSGGNGLMIDAFQSTGSGADGVGLIEIGDGGGNTNMVDLNASYEVSASGTLRTQGFAIKQDGIVRQPERRANVSSSSSSQQQPSYFTSSSAAAADANPSPFLTNSLTGETTTFSPKDLVELGSVGKGACGIVKRALYIPSMQVVALKQINIYDKDKRHQFVKELSALGAVNSPYIVGFLGAWYSEGSITILLEYANRHSLLEALKASGPFDEICLQRIALHTFRGLEILHGAHVIHRDIKPGNILINSNFQSKLTDFGVVTALEGTMDLATTFVGTTMYMAPERVTQDGKYSYASDVWSLGVSLWYLAVGELPYSSNGGYWGIVKSIRDDPVPQLPAVSPANKKPYSAQFIDFLNLCLQKDPSKRSTASQLLQHPFLRDAERTWDSAAKSSNAPIHPLMNISAIDREDLDAILSTIYNQVYANGKAEYRKSLMDQARFQKLAENLNNPNFTAKSIQARFEELYAATRAQEKKK